ncbi:hypothetical protein BDZ91DRAFT_746314 [Kalaharituber pfeilii]|nr:hypothetical protein BDZ91DRAFT_746314 [Kalaharituber pfeilii]
MSTRFFSYPLYVSPKLLVVVFCSTSCFGIHIPTEPGFLRRLYCRNGPLEPHQGVICIINPVRDAAVGTGGGWGGGYALFEVIRLLSLVTEVTTTRSHREV